MGLLRCGLAAAALAGVAPAGASELAPLRSQHSPVFSADIVLAPASGAQPIARVTISVPYQQLEWVRTSGGYEASAEFTVVFEPEKHGRHYGGVWERQIDVQDFEATLTPGLACLETRSFEVPPGRYRARVQVRDVNSDLSASVQDRVDVADVAHMELAFEDLELGTRDSAGGFAPVPSRRFGQEVATIAARVTLVDHRSGSWPRSYVLGAKLLDDLGNEMRRKTFRISLASSGQPVVLAPDSVDLSIGDYRLEVELQDPRTNSKVRVRTVRLFEVEESGSPHGTRFRLLLEPLAYLASPAEMKLLHSLPEARQAEGWEEFWRRRDPTPETPRNEAMIEFYRRVRYAERHFEGFGPGWRSDMGRIYIKFGPADQIESHPGDAVDPATEIWIYNSPKRRFVFLDHDGFGHFLLTGSPE